MREIDFRNQKVADIHGRIVLKEKKARGHGIELRKSGCETTRRESLRKNEGKKKRWNWALIIFPRLAVALAVVSCFGYMREFRKESERRFEEAISRLESMQDFAEKQGLVLIQRINTTDAQIGRINSVYGNLLAEQRKKTIDKVYREEDLEGRMKSGLELLADKKYGQARVAFMQVLNQEPDNMSARFYAAHSLFCENRLDRSQYGELLKEVAILRANGFDRPEIAEMEAFINDERNGLREDAEGGL